MILGLDPGVSGAIAIMSLDGTAMEIHDMPALETICNKKIRHEINAVELAQLFIDIRSNNCAGIDMVYVEQVGPMPTDGAIQAFRFGQSFGTIKGVIGALSLPTTFIRPQAWKKAMLTGSNNAKDASRQKAIELFPHMAIHLKRAKDHGRAESLLIAEYGRRTMRS